MALRDRYIRLDAPVRREVLTQLGKAADPATADFVRGQVEDRSVKLAAMTALRRFGRPSDHALFLQAIVDDDVEVARVGVGAVSTLDITLTDETIFELIGQLSRSPGRPDRTRLRDAILELLTSRVDHPPAKRRTETVRDEMQMVLDWQEWFVDTHPDFSREFPPVRDPLRSWVDRRNVAGELLRRVAWSDGDAETGRRQFDRLGCARCHVHSGRGEPFGPDLTGVGKRLARRDLLDAVVLPSKFVPPRYAYTLLRLDDGRVLGGVVDGERNGVLRVRTSGDEVLEIEAAGVVDRVMQTMSPMPTGTLDPASDRDIADLFAFLSTGQPPAATAPAAR
jgi:putative heme-binding domain-containing protein